MVTAERKLRRGLPAKPQRNEELVRLVNAGLSLKEAAARFGISRQRCGQIYNAAKPAADKE